MRRTLGCCVLLLLAGGSSASGKEQPTPGATAQALSFIAVGAAKLAVNHEATPQSRIDQACVQRLDDSALANLFEGLLREQMTDRQREEADRFYARPFAVRYNQLTLQQILGAKTGKPVEHPFPLSPSEVAEINRFVASETGAALTHVASEPNAATLEQLRPAVIALLGTCRKA
jgi:hypothetical protein